MKLYLIKIVYLIQHHIFILIYLVMIKMIYQIQNLYHSKIRPIICATSDLNQVIHELSNTIPTILIIQNRNLLKDNPIPLDFCKQIEIKYTSKTNYLNNLLENYLYFADEIHKFKNIIQEKEDIIEKQNKLLSNYKK